MNKISILGVAKLYILYDTNKMFAHMVDEEAYCLNMEQQLQDFKAIFGEKNETIDASGEFIRVKDHVHFVETVKIIPSLGQKFLNLYHDAAGALNHWCSLSEVERGGKDWYAVVTANDRLVKELNSHLRQYEILKQDDIDRYLRLIIDGKSYMSEWQTDGEKVYEHITKVYK